MKLTVKATNAKHVITNSIAVETLVIQLFLVLHSQCSISLQFECNNVCCGVERLQRQSVSDYAHYSHRISYINAHAEQMK